MGGGGGGGVVSTFFGQQGKIGHNSECDPLGLEEGINFSKSLVFSRKGIKGGTTQSVIWLWWERTSQE